MTKNNNEIIQEYKLRKRRSRRELRIETSSWLADTLGFAEAEPEFNEAPNKFTCLIFLGFLLYTACYDWFIATSGVWKTMDTTVNELVTLSTQIRGGCPMYKPSRTAHFLSKYGFGYYGYGDARVIESVDSIIQCMTVADTAAIQLSEMYKTEYNKEELHRLFMKLSEDVPEIHPSKFLQIEPPSSFSFHNATRENASTIPSTTSYAVLAENTDHFDKIMIENLEILAKMKPVEFERFMYSSGMIPHYSFAPAPYPNPTVPSPPPIKDRIFRSPVTMVTFVNDLYGMFYDVAPEKWTASFSIQNIVLYTIQDEIRDALRKMEDMKIIIKRTVEDKITTASRLITEVTALPQILYTLWLFNSVSIYIVCHYMSIQRYESIKGIKN
jgi:hypothetical protein